jgi:hypothetical protein
LSRKWPKHSLFFSLEKKKQKKVFFFNATLRQFGETAFHCSTEEENSRI